MNKSEEKTMKTKNLNISTGNVFHCSPEEDGSNHAVLMNLELVDSIAFFYITLNSIHA